MPDTELSLYAANGSKILIYGTCMLAIDLGLRQPLRRTFEAAKIDRVILGADFFTAFNSLHSYQS